MFRTSVAFRRQSDLKASPLAAGRAEKNTDLRMQSAKNN